MASLFLRPNSPYYWLKIYDKHEAEPEKKRKAFSTKIEATEADLIRFRTWCEKGKQGKRPKLQGNGLTKNLLLSLNAGFLENDILSKTGIQIKNRIKFSDGYREFMSQHPEYSASTIKEKKRIRDLMIDAAGDKTLADYTTSDYVSLLDLFEELKFSQATMNMHTAHLKPVFSYFKEKKYIQDNIIKVVTAVKGNPEPISRKEMKIILKHFESKIDFWKDKRKVEEAKQQYHLVQFLLMTGMRISSALVQDWKDVLLDEDLIKVTNVKRQDRQFYFPIYKELKELLQDMLPKNSGRLFHNFNTSQPKFFERATKWLKKENKISDYYTFHNLRDTFASWMADSGVDMSHVQDLLDHSDIRVTKEHYTKVRAKTKLKQFNKIKFKKG